MRTKTKDFDSRFCSVSEKVHERQLPVMHLVIGNAVDPLCGSTEAVGRVSIFLVKPGDLICSQCYRTARDRYPSTMRRVLTSGPRKVKR